MAALTASIPPAVVQDRDARRDDLAADLRALTDRSGNVDAFMVLSRPSVLRRLARLIAEHLPVGIDRLVGSRGQDDALACAVSLHTGIPFAVIDPSSGTVFGELHTSEAVAVVCTRQAGARPVQELIEELGVRTALTVSVFGDPAQASAGLSRALFSAAELTASGMEGAAA